jgi:hypothetical protein
LRLRETTNNKQLCFRKSLEHVRPRARSGRDLLVYSGHALSKFESNETRAGRLRTQRVYVPKPYRYTLTCRRPPSRRTFREVGVSLHIRYVCMAHIYLIKYVPGLRLSRVVVYVCVRVLKLMCSHPAASAEGGRGFPKLSTSCVLIKSTHLNSIVNDTLAPALAYNSISSGCAEPL